MPITDAFDIEVAGSVLVGAIEQGNMRLVCDTRRRHQAGIADAILDQFGDQRIQHGGGIVNRCQPVTVPVAMSMTSPGPAKHSRVPGAMKSSPQARS